MFSRSIDTQLKLKFSDELIWTYACQLANYQRHFVRWHFIDLVTPSINYDFPMKRQNFSGSDVPMKSTTIENTILIDVNWWTVCWQRVTRSARVRVSHFSTATHYDIFANCQKNLIFRRKSLALVKLREMKRQFNCMELTSFECSIHFEEFHRKITVQFQSIDWAIAFFG